MSATPNTIENLERVGRWLARFTLFAGAVILGVMLALTLVDVFGRYVFNSPVNGKTELTRFMMAGLIACALPVIANTGEHIAVDLFDKFYSARAARIRDIIVDIIMAASMVILGDWILFRAARLLKRGYTSDFLDLPLHPIAYFIAVMVFASAAALVVKLVIDTFLLAAPHHEPERKAPPTNLEI